MATKRELKDALDRAADAIGSKYKMAQELGLTKSSVYFWTHVPEHQIKRVAELSGLSPAELRPDLAELFK